MKVHLQTRDLLGGGSLLFSSKMGGILSKSSLLMAFRDFGRRYLQVPYFGPHIMRDIFISHVYQTGLRSFESKMNNNNNNNNNNKL
jgi:hypothetical protein